MAGLLARRYQDEEGAREYLEQLLWPDDPICPKCGVIDEAYRLKGETTRDGLYECAGCRAPFTVTTPEKPMPMMLEAWPGGRWFRDPGNNTGHFWGTVQAIKTPSLLKSWGLLFMSAPAVSNLQYRFEEENGATRMRFVHRAVGWIDEQERGVDARWNQLMARISAAATKRVGS